MMIQPKISVIMPSYNTPESFFRAAIDSVLNQTYKNLELIVVDDGSDSPDIKKVIDGYKDKRLVYINQGHNGAGQARNIGIAHASGDYIYVIDSDDIIDDDTFEVCVKLVQEHNPDIVIFKLYGQSNDGKVTVFHHPVGFEITNPGPTTKIIKKDLITKNDVKYENFKSCNDLTFVYSILACAQKVVKINKCFYHYNTNVPNQISATRGNKATNVILAFDALKSNLEKYGLFKVYKKSFNKVFVGCVKGEIQNITDDEYKKTFLDTLKAKYPVVYRKVCDYKYKIFGKQRVDRDTRVIWFCGFRLFSYTKRRHHSNHMKKLNYKTYNDLAHDIKSRITDIPNDIDLIVGIPRSGMIPAYIIALALNKPVCSVPEFINGIQAGHGITRKVRESGKIKNVLFVDDTVNSGNSIIKLKSSLGDLMQEYNCKFLTVYASDAAAADKVDIALHILPTPRCFQWNYMHHSLNAQSCFDIDGVLCVDPTDEQNDDGKNYIKFIKNAVPLYVPNGPIGYIVTSRLERYRKETEQWLADHGIEYKKMYMFDGTAEERRTLGLHAEFKAKIYKQLTDSGLFIESNPRQASKIAELTGKRVICCENDQMYFTGV